MAHRSGSMFCTAGRSAWRRTCRRAPSGAGRRRRTRGGSRAARASGCRCRRIWWSARRACFWWTPGPPRTVSSRAGVEDRAAQLRMFGPRVGARSCTASWSRGSRSASELAARGVRPRDLGLCALFPPRSRTTSRASARCGAPKQPAGGGEREYYWCRAASEPALHLRRCGWTSRRSGSGTA